MDMDKFYTIEDVRTFLKISDTTVRRYIKAGTLKACKFGRQYRITESALRKFVEEKKITEESVLDNRE